jgi:tetratricopeptide (TPR) repeat protein
MEHQQRNAELNPDLKALEQSGWLRFENREYDLAISDFDQALGLDETTEGALQGKIASLRKKRAYSEAASSLRQALALHPRSIGLLSERGWLHYERREYAEAISAFDEVLKVDPVSESKVVWKTSLLRTLRRWEEAENTLREAQVHLPDSLAIQVEHGWLQFDQRQYDEASNLFAAVLRRDPLNELALQGRVAVARMAGNIGEARQLLTTAILQKPDSAGLRSEEGWLHFTQEQFERAEESFRRVLELQPYDVFSIINLAWTLVWQGRDEDLEQATERCRAALKLDPELSQAYGCLGVIAFKRGRLREAETNLLRSIRLDPAQGRMADLGALYTQMGRYDEAEKALQRAREINPDDAYARVELGNLLLVTDRVKEAIREFRIARAVDPSHADPPRALAIALLESGKLVEAEKTLREALRELDQSKRWQLHLTLGHVLTRVGDETGEPTFYQDALKEINTAVRLKDTRVEPYFYAGIVRYKLGDHAGALKHFQKCTSLDGRHLEADLNARRLRAFLRSEARSHVSRAASYVLAGIFLVNMSVVWVVFLTTSKISQQTMLVITPLILTLVLASIMLPWMSRLKLAGLEAELTELKPKEALAAGPKGEIGFDTTLTSMAGR